MTSNWLFSEHEKFQLGNEAIWAIPCPHCERKGLQHHIEHNKITCHCCGYEVRI
ncbi:Uncharacterised protein [uncultured archaeon]|nr:Uncharacterised protein [uncultured archaeon]